MKKQKRNLKEKTSPSQPNKQLDGKRKTKMKPQAKIKYKQFTLKEME